MGILLTLSESLNHIVFYRLGSGGADESVFVTLSAEATLTQTFSATVISVNSSNTTEFYLNNAYVNSLQKDNIILRLNELFRIKQFIFLCAYAESKINEYK